MRGSSADHAGHTIVRDDVARAARIAGEYARRTGTSHLRDEWESAALMALGRAALAFDGSRGEVFWVYADPVVRGSVANAARDWRPRGYRKGGGAPEVVAVDPDDDAFREGDEPPVGWDVEWRDEVDGLARRLPPAVARPFRAYYGGATTLAHAGRMAGVSQSWVVQCLAAAHEYLRERFREDDLFMPGRRPGEMHP